jgi:hypothetical protein
MKRALELVEPLPPKIEDCFAEFDKVFDSLAGELDWQDARPAARVNSIEAIDAAAPPTAHIALVPPKPAPVPPAAPAPEPKADVLEQYESAFSALDDKLAESDGANVTALTERPARRLPSDRRAANDRAVSKSAPAGLLKPKRVRRVHRTFDDVFDVLESISIVRRRGRLSDERHLVASLLGEARQLCADLDLQTARVRVEFAVLTLENDHFDKLASEIDELARHIRHDLRFCSIAPGKKAASR